jgi:hypothetical protein
MKIEVIKNKVLLDGKKWGTKPNNMDLGEYILNLLFYCNRDGNKSFELFVNGVNETEIFKNQVKEKYAQIKNTQLRDNFYTYSNITK